MYWSDLLLIVFPLLWSVSIGKAIIAPQPNDEDDSSTITCGNPDDDDASSSSSCMDKTNGNTIMNSNTPLFTVRELMQQQPPEEWVTVLGGIYEHSPWVAETLTAKETSHITTVTALYRVLQDIVDAATDEQKMTLLQKHPDLGLQVEERKTLTEESQDEQSKSGLANLTPDELVTFTTLNRAYKEQFGFPFILAVRNASKQTVLSALKGRVSNTKAEEFVQAMTQVHKIAWMRLLSKVNLEDAQGYLTCHVLDTANGIPAANMRITLHRLTSSSSSESNTRQLIGEYVTNSDGRLEQGPALKGGTEFLVGTYEWTFYVGDYFASTGSFVSGTPFLDVIPLRFGIDNPDDHYHVPLLVSPWSFSTYRGS